MLPSSKSTESLPHGAAGNCSRNHKSKSLVDYVTTNANSCQGESQLHILEDNEAVIKMIIKGRSPTMRHVSRTHRVALDWLFDRIKDVDTKNQLANMLTKGSSSRDEWDHLLRVLNIMNFSMFSCSHSLSNRTQSVVSKRGQKSPAEEGSAVTKPRPMSFVSRTLLSAKKTLQQDSSAPNSPGNQELGQSSVTWSARKLVRDNQQHILKSSDIMTLYLGAPGNWSGVVNLQVQRASGNWCEVMTIKSKGQGWRSLHANLRSSIP